MDILSDCIKKDNRKESETGLLLFALLEEGNIKMNDVKSDKGKKPVMRSVHLSINSAKYYDRLLDIFTTQYYEQPEEMFCLQKIAKSCMYQTPVIFPRYKEEFDIIDEGYMKLIKSMVKLALEEYIYNYKCLHRLIRINKDRRYRLENHIGYNGLSDYWEELKKRYEFDEKLISKKTNDLHSIQTFFYRYPLITPIYEETVRRLYKFSDPEKVTYARVTQGIYI